MNDPASMIPAYASAGARTRWLAALLIGTAILGWFAVGFDLADLRQLSRESRGEWISDLERRSHARLRAILFATQAALCAAGAVAFLLWIHLSRRNLRALGARRLDYATPWAVAGCLIPGINLVRPYQVVREIWKASDPGIADPFAWKTSRVPVLLPLWWGTTLAFAGFAALSAAMGSSAGDSLHHLGFARASATLADLAAGIGASLGYFVVRRVGEAQQEKHRLRSAQAPAEADAAAGP